MYDFIWSHVRPLTSVPATRDPLDPSGTIFCKLSIFVAHMFHSTSRPLFLYHCGTSRKLLEEDVTTYQQRLGSYLKKMLQRIRNVLQVTWRRRYNVSATSCKLLEEDFTTYQERLASYLKKMLQRIRNVLQVIWRRCYKVSGTSCKYLKKMLQRIRNVLQILEEDVTTYQECLQILEENVTTYQERLANTWRRCYNVSGTSCKYLKKMLQRIRNVLQILEEDVTTYQERLASYLQKILQRSRKLLLTTQTTGRYYNPPSPQPPPEKKNVKKWQQSRPSMGAVTLNYFTNIDLPLAHMSTDFVQHCATPLMSESGLTVSCFEPCWVKHDTCIGSPRLRWLLH